MRVARGEETSREMRSMMITQCAQLICLQPDADPLDLPGDYRPTPTLRAKGDRVPLGAPFPYPTRRNRI